MDESGLAPWSVLLKPPYRVTFNSTGFSTCYISKLHRAVIRQNQTVLPSVCTPFSASRILGLQMPSYCPCWGAPRRRNVWLVSAVPSRLDVTPRDSLLCAGGAVASASAPVAGLRPPCSCLVLCLCTFNRSSVAAKVAAPWGAQGHLLGELR